MAEASAVRDEKTDRAIERLRQSRQQAEKEWFKVGFDLGTRWAQDTAEFPQLQCLQRLWDQLESDPAFRWACFFNGEGQSAYAVSELLFFQINPECDKDRDAARDFWDVAVGEDRPHRSETEFLRGFAEGALDFWDKVKGDI